MCILFVQCADVGQHLMLTVAPHDVVSPVIPRSRAGALDMFDFIMSRIEN